MSDSLKIIYILDDRYWYPVTVSAKSALLCFKSEEVSAIEFIFLVDGVTTEHQKMMKQELETVNSLVRFVTLDMSLFNKFPNYHGSKLVWTRCRINSILPEIDDWICVCDGDTLWLKSPEEVFKLTHDVGRDVVVIGSDNNGRPDEYVDHFLRLGVKVPEKSYFCMGFVLLHLGRMKALAGEMKADAFLKEFGIPPWNEQDIFNVIFLDNKQILPKGWGVSPGHISSVSVDGIGVVHYYGSLPWPSSYLGRMSDAEALWWRFSIRNVNVCPNSTQFEMSWFIYIIMRFWNFLIRIFPNGVLAGRIKDARLPIRRMLYDLEKNRNGL